MKNPVFTGAGVAIITPMYEDGSINFDELGRIIEDQIAHHTDAIIICGTTGECSTMTDEEQLAAIKYTVEVVNHRVPVIAGAGSNDTDHGCALAAKSAECGADALLMVTPYYNKTTQAGLVAHFTAMAEAGGIPVIMYNVPSRTGLNIAPETALELSKHPLINGIKEAAAELGMSDDQIVWKYKIAEGGVTADAAEDLVGQGCNLIISNSYGHQTYMEEEAEKYPDINFVAMTGDFAAISDLDNFYNAFTAVYQSRYVSGVVAGMKVKDLVESGTLDPRDPARQLHR